MVILEACVRQPTRFEIRKIKWHASWQIRDARPCMHDTDRRRGAGGCQRVPRNDAKRQCMCMTTYVYSHIHDAGRFSQLVTRIRHCSSLCVSLPCAPPPSVRNPIHIPRCIVTSGAKIACI